MRLRLLAIAWIMLLITIAVDTTDLVEKNRRSVHSILSESEKKEDFDLFGDWMNRPVTTTPCSATTEVDLRASHTILLDQPASKNSKLNRRIPRKSLESFSDSELFQDSNEIDPESLKPHIRVKRRSNFRRSIGKPPSYVHRVPRRTFERFLSEEMNPADESEAEYGSSLDDDIDVPGVFLNDEISNKRNRLEDVYPEVKSRSVKRDHSPPEFLKPASDSEGTTRQKREKERDGECANEEDEEEYYYDDEDETENLKSGERDSQAVASKASSSINAAKVALEQPELNQEDMQVIENNQNSNIEGVNLNSPVHEKYTVAVVKGKSSANSSAKRPNKNKHNNKPKPKKKPPVPKKPNNNKKSPFKNQSHPHKQTPKGKTRTMPKPKPKPHKKPKSNVAALVDSERDQLKGENQDNFAGCCGKAKAQEKEKNKKVKTLVIKAVPKSDNMQELQIYEKPNSSKKVEASKPAVKSNVVERKAEMSMGEMRNLLQRLIGKVDNLVSEIRSERADRLEGNSNHINCIAKTRRRAAAGA